METYRNNDTDPEIPTEYPNMSLSYQPCRPVSSDIIGSCREEAEPGPELHGIEDCRGVSTLQVLRTP